MVPRPRRLFDEVVITPPDRTFSREATLTLDGPGGGAALPGTRAHRQRHRGRRARRRGAVRRRPDRGEQPSLLRGLVPAGVARHGRRPARPGGRAGGPRARGGGRPRLRGRPAPGPGRGGPPGRGAPRRRDERRATLPPREGPIPGTCCRRPSPGSGRAWSWGARPLAPSWFTARSPTSVARASSTSTAAPSTTSTGATPAPPAWSSSTAGRPTPTGGTSSPRCFTYHWRAVALDLSGHGDSGRRAAYPAEAWASEVAAVVRHAAFPAPAGDRRPQPGRPGRHPGGPRLLPRAGRGGAGGRGDPPARPDRWRRGNGAAGLPLPGDLRHPGGGGRALPPRPRAARRPRLHPRPHRPPLPAPQRRRLDVEVRPGGASPGPASTWPSGWRRSAAASPSSTESAAPSSPPTPPPTCPS